MLVATLQDADGTVLGEATHLCEGLAGAAMADPALQARWRPLGDGLAEVTVQARTVALSVHFALEGWRAESAYFDLAPGAVRHVRLHRIAVPHSPLADSIRGCVLAANAARPVLLQAA